MSQDHSTMGEDMLRRHITAHFAYHEFIRSGDNVPDSAIRAIVALAGRLEELRKVVGGPIIVISGYRTPEHNRAVGGAVRSQHMAGTAADIYRPGLGMNHLYQVADGMFNGVGLYSSHVHVDMGPPGRRWRG